MLDSEVNHVVYVEGKEDQLVGAIINTAWPVDHTYEFFEADPVMWLNIAAEIAKEETDDPLYSTIIWRDYHFQLIYHTNQVLSPLVLPAFLILSIH